MDSPRGSMQSSSGGGDAGGEEEHTSFSSTAAAYLPPQFAAAAGGFFANYASEFDPFAYAPRLGAHTAQPSSMADPDISAALPTRPTGSAARPKKRPRASRRAPTTVLTTDTSNFRQMVQEFTGIPPQPFSSLQPRTDGRFGSGATTRRAAALEPKILLRPFPQKVPITSLRPFTSGSPPAGINVTPELPSCPFPSLTQSLSLLDPRGPTALVGGSGIPTSSGPPGLLFMATREEGGGGGGGGLDQLWANNWQPGAVLPPAATRPEAAEAHGTRGSPARDGTADTWLCSLE